MNPRTKFGTRGPRPPSGALLAMTFLIAANGVCNAQEKNTQVIVDWSKPERVSKTTPTLQVVVSPFLRRESPSHDRIFSELTRLGADYVRFDPWLHHPRLDVAELEPPADGKTSWDLSLIDPIAIDFLEATKGHSVVMDFSTMPAWMWKTDKPVPYPTDPDEITWSYTQGSVPRDPTFTEIANYYARLLSWYTRGGFTDELGKRHISGYRYSLPYWEVLNEVDLEHHLSPETYTKLYDAVVTALRRIQPNLKFVGMSLADASRNPNFFEYFLDHRNHRPGIPLDCISYHFYATGEADVPAGSQGYAFFEQADGFLNTVRYVEGIRKRLSPATCTMINEIGAFADPDVSGDMTKPMPEAHLNRSAALYAYLFGELARMGINAAAMSLLVGYAKVHPSLTMGDKNVQRRSISMLDWMTGEPNPRFRVLELLKSALEPGDKFVHTETDSRKIYAQGFVSQGGEHRLLLVNKRERDIQVTIPQKAKQTERVDTTTNTQPAVRESVSADLLTLHPYAVVVATLE